MRTQRELIRTILQRQDELEQKLDLVHDDQHHLMRHLQEIIQMLNDITAAVTENGTVIGSAVALLNGLSAKIESMKNDPVKLAALATELRSKSGELSAAVVANTPAEGEPAPEISNM